MGVDMNDLDLLKEFRREPGRDVDTAGVHAAWAALIDRIGIGTAGNAGNAGVDPGLVVHRRPRRRWRVAAVVAAAVAGLVFGLPALLPSGAPGGARRAAAAVSFTNDGRYIVAVITDPQADSADLRAAFQQHGLDIALQLLPVSPSLVGKVVFEDDSADGNGSAIETLYDPNAGCTTPGGLECPIGLRIPVDFTGHATIALGRAAQPGEVYASSNDAWAPGEALHCSGLLGMTVQQALPVLAQRGLTAVWRSTDASIDNGNGIDPAIISDLYVTEATPLAEGQVFVWV